MGLLHDIRMTGEVKASYDFQATGFTVEIVCKDIPEDVIMEEIERCQSVLQERLDFLHAPAQEHLDKLLDARGE
ncbi:MAG: hypothetical protein KDB07_06855, partial [Planctomycetes bacterium]|nr:hypothetical protein [Planctomycetota bacterium]